MTNQSNFDIFKRNTSNHVYYIADAFLYIIYYCKKKKKKIEERINKIEMKVVYFFIIDLVNIPHYKILAFALHFFVYVLRTIFVL